MGNWIHSQFSSRTNELDIIEIINDFLESTTDKEISTRFVSEKGVADNPKDILEVIG